MSSPQTYPTGSTWSWADVYDLLGDGLVEFSGWSTGTVFTVVTTPVNAIWTVCPRDDDDWTDRDRIDTMTALYRQHGWPALPPILLDTDGAICDGDHRLAAALDADLSFDAVPAFTAAEQDTHPR